MNFVEALYTGKRYIRCPYVKGELKGRAEIDTLRYAEFDTLMDAIFDLTTLHDIEFLTNDWEASDDEFFGEDND